MNVDQLKDLLRRYNLSPNFTYGQNFLIDDIALQDIVDAAGVSKEDTVLEIGPGIGNLTRELCARAGFVLSVEKDPGFLPVLKSIKKDFKNFHWEISDILKFDFAKALGGQQAADGEGTGVHAERSGLGSAFGRDGSALNAQRYKVVANIPYYITGKILQLFMTAKHKPSTITILTQKEVAQNVIAPVGELSILAISVQLYGEPSVVQIVPARSFYPAPKVDSAVLQIKLFDTPKYEIGDEKKFFGILRACFAGKRKQLHNTLHNNLGLPKERVTEILSQLKIDPAARPQELSIGQWAELCDLIEHNQ